MSCIRQPRAFEYESPADPHVMSVKFARARKSSVKKAVHRRAKTQSSAVRGNYSCNMALHGPSGPCRMACLSFCSPARLLRHTSRHRERTITIPIMATPSFMPNQMKSNVSTVHHLSQRAARHFVPDAQSPVEHLHHEGQFWKKRWYLAQSVNGCSTAFPFLLQLPATGSLKLTGSVQNHREADRGRNMPHRTGLVPVEETGFAGRRAKEPWLPNLVSVSATRPRIAQ